MALGVVSLVSFHWFKEGFAQAPPEGVTVEGRIEVVPGKDYNREGEIDAGDTVNLLFLVKNDTDTEYSFASLSTGVDASRLHDLWNIKGAGSIVKENGTLVFKNLRLLPRSKVSMSIEATIDYFTEGELELAVTPQLAESSGQSFGTRIENDHATRTVEPWEGDLPWWVYDPPVVSPTPTPSPTPTVTVTPSSTPTPTVTPTPSPTSTPSETPTPTVTPTATPTPTPAISESPSPSPTAISSPVPSP